jgi:hypothetical protein
VIVRLEPPRYCLLVPIEHRKDDLGHASVKGLVGLPDDLHNVVACGDRSKLGQCPERAHRFENVVALELLP